MPPARKPKLVPEPETGGWKFRSRTTTGARPWLHLPPMPLAQAEKVALEMAGILKTEDVEALPKVSTPGPETVAKWFERWCKLRRAKNIKTVHEDESRFKNHIAPFIGDKAMAHVTRRDLEAVRDNLDQKVRERLAAIATAGVDDAGEGEEPPKLGRLAGLSGKTAGNVWQIVRSMFLAATRSKQRDLRVREDDAAANIEPPDETPHLEGPILYASEFLQLMRCEDVPLKARRLVALALYTYTRQGELRARRWRDADIEHQRIAILTSIDRRTGKEGPTKTSAPRTPEIEPNLVPLLEAMKGDAMEPITWMPPEEDGARLLREWLWTAGVRRRDLHQDTRTTRRIVFHDLRHVACTWAAARGDSAFVIMAKSGHTDLGTVNGYVEKWGNVKRSTFGVPFPPLPAELFGPPKWTKTRDSDVEPGETTSENSATPTGIEPVLPA